MAELDRLDTSRFTSKSLSEQAAARIASSTGETSDKDKKSRQETISQLQETLGSWLLVKQHARDLRALLNRKGIDELDFPPHVARPEDLMELDKGVLSGYVFGLRLIDTGLLGKNYESSKLPEKSEEGYVSGYLLACLMHRVAGGTLPESAKRYREVVLKKVFGKRA